MPCMQLVVVFAVSAFLATECSGGITQTHTRAHVHAHAIRGCAGGCAVMDSCGPGVVQTLNRWRGTCHGSALFCAGHCWGPSAELDALDACVQPWAPSDGVRLRPRACLELMDGPYYEVDDQVCPGVHWKGGGGRPPVQGARPVPSHCLPDGKCQLQWHL